MELRLFQDLPEEARAIRQAVFVEEQGFEEEFDDVDKTATHVVVFDGDQALGTCRFFFDAGRDSYVIGRFAMDKEARGRYIASYMMESVLDILKFMGVPKVELAAQQRVENFYKKNGFIRTDEEGFDEEGCPHVWMRQVLKKD